MKPSSNTCMRCRLLGLCRFPPPSPPAAVRLPLPPSLPPLPPLLPTPHQPRQRAVRYIPQATTDTRAISRPDSTQKLRLGLPASGGAAAGGGGLLLRVLGAAAGGAAAPQLVQLGSDHGSAV